MKNFFSIFILLVIVFQTAQAQQSLGEKEKIDQILSNNNCETKDIVVAVEEPEFTVINENPENCKINKENLYFVGALIGTHYLRTTDIVGVSAEFLRLKNNKKIYHINLDYGTNRLLRMSSADSFQHLTLGFNYHIAKSSFFVGANAQLLNINNKAIGENGSHDYYYGLLASAGYQQTFFDRRLLVGAKANLGVIQYFEEKLAVSGVVINIGWRISKQ